MLFVKLVLLILAVPVIIVLWKIYQQACDHMWENDSHGHVKCRKCTKRLKLQQE
jgi:hypothetical protein